VPLCSCATVGAVVHLLLGAAEHETPVLDRPVAAGSLKIAPVTELGPPLVARIV
jgi:hypothetical protein